MAAVVAPARVSAKHQSLLHLVGQAAWSDEAVLAKVRELVLPAIEAQGKIEAWIVDDTGFAKKGVHSVGVARQYCGRLGKTDNCQIAVTLSIANHAASLPIAYQLYLPQDWAGDEARRKKVRVPDDVKFRTKPEIALAQIRTALAAGVAPGVLLTDAGYGADGAFRSGVTASGLAYVVGVQSTLSVWPPAPNRCRPNPGAGGAARHRACAATANMSLFPPRHWRGGFPRRLGASFHGGRALTKSCLRASRPCGFGRLRGTGRFRRPIRWNGCSSNGPRAKKSRRNTGFRPCPKTRPSTFSSTRPNCAGASSATTRNSKANSASPISKGEAGAASIITQPCASPLMDSLSANERRFPPQAPRGAKHLVYPPVPDPEARARAVLLTLAGWTSPKIAEAFGVREDTVRLWRSDFTAGGVAAVKASIAPGPPPMKSEAALRVATPLLEEPVADRRNWTIPRLRAEIEAHEGVRISRSQLSKALRKKSSAGGGPGTR